MEYLDRKWMERLSDSFDAQGREFAKYRPERRCNKSVLADRYFSWLDGKYFKLLIKGTIYYAMFNKATWTVDRTWKHNCYGVDYHLGYHPIELNISFYNERLKMERIKMSWNDFLAMKYKEITSKEFFNVASLFFEEDIDTTNLT